MKDDMQDLLDREPQTMFPGVRPRGRDAGGEPVMLEGMKVLFDDKVGLYPVTLIAKTGAKRVPRNRG